MKLKRISKKINYLLIIGIMASSLLLFGVVVLAYKSSTSIINKGIDIVISVAGDELKTDTSNNTNFLLLGTGGKNHEGSNLTDSIMIASIDNDTKEITMLSIPRDLYVMNSNLGSYKINEAFFRGKKQAPTEEKEVEFGIKNLEKNLEDMIGIEIQYWAKIDFEGLVGLVNILDGIDVYVDKAIYDPTYPKDGTYEFEPFRIKKGEQHLDGATALKYARSRHTTSDFDRARRQQKILTAIKEKAINKDIIFSKSKIEEILDSLNENIKTNITTEELLTLAGIIKDTTSENIHSKVLHDDPQFCGGLLYTPSREYYDGMFILRPAGGKIFLARYMNLLMNYQDALNKQEKIQILNGTKIAGVATNTRSILERFCFNTYRHGNGRNQLQEFTTYYYFTKKDNTGKIITKEPSAIKALQTLIPGKISTEIPEEYIKYFTGTEANPDLKTDIIIELGNDYVQSNAYINDPYYSLPDVKAWVPDTDDSDEGQVE